MPDETNFQGQQGRSGFTDAFNDFMQMYNETRDFVDIMILLRENYPEDIVDTVLADARSRGLL
jgi:hypothetical protein